MAKKSEQNEEFDLTEAPEKSELQTAQAREDMLLKRIAEMERRLARTEFAGGNKNKQRQFDEMTGKDENIRVASLPSLDGVHPIINWYQAPGSKVTISPAGYVQDDQSWVVQVKGGDDQRLSLDEIPSLVSGNGITVRINNWKAYRREIDEIADLRHKYQKATGQNSSFNLKELREEIENREKNLTVNVTLSEDRGKTFEGEQFDVLAKMLNGHR